MHSLLFIFFFFPFLPVVLSNPSFAVHPQGVHVYVCCVSLLIRSVQRYSVEWFVVHSYVLMAQELKSSMICCHFRQRLIGECTSRSGLSVSSTAVVRYVRREKAGGSFGVLRKKEKRRKKEE